MSNVIELQCFVDGKQVATDERIPIRDVEGNVIATAPDFSPYALTKAVRAARKGKAALDKLSYQDICRIFSRAAEFYNDTSFDLPISLARGNTMTKVIGARENIQQMMRSFEQVVDHAFNRQFVQSKNGEFGVTHYYDPVGIVSIIPASTAREIAPWVILSALAVGNAVIVKLDSKEPFSVVEVEHSLREAGLPAGALNTVFWDTKKKPDMGPRLLQVTDKSVLFGWDHTIREISYFDLKDKLAPEILRQLPIPPNVVAFGTGRSKAILFDVEDVDAAAHSLAHAATFAPTECLKVQFVVIHDALKERFINAYAKAISALSSGDRTSVDTMVGQTSGENRGFVTSVVDDAVKLGAKKILGGDVFCEPTLFEGVHTESILFREETPAPMLGLVTAKNIAEAIDLVNTSVRFSESKQSLAVAIYTDNDDIYRECLTTINACRITRNTPPIHVDHLSPHQGVFLPVALTTVKGAR